MNSDFYDDKSCSREFDEGGETPSWRKPFSRDYGRVIHSASFRRLQGKTQVFPGHESDFFRNRLTHSLEVAQIAEGIADRLNEEHEWFSKHNLDAKLCSTAALIHDLGHPPFGHNGERALDNVMLKHGGFEGNAQTLRIVARLEKKIRDESGRNYGLNLSMRSLAAILKYDRKIPRSRKHGTKLVKGYYASEEALVSKIKQAILNDRKNPGDFKTIECSIMDLADDIAYSTYDLEDSLKAGFLTPADILSSSPTLFRKVAEKVQKELGYSFTPAQALKEFIEIFAGLMPGFSSANESPIEILTDLYGASKDLASSGYFRTQLSSQMIGSAIKAVEVDFNSKIPVLSRVKLNRSMRERVEVVKQFVFIATIYSSRVTIPEFRGYEVVKGIFEALAGDRGELLMPEDVREQMEGCSDDDDERMRIICDFVAGMTDRYAMEFYGRLHSDSPQSMFKPI